MQKLQLLFIVSLFAVQQALECYDCDPSEVQQCLDPYGSNVKTTLCDVAEDTTSECFTMYYLPGDTSTELEGYYRGCISSPNSDDQLTCDYIAQLLEGNVVTCGVCSEDLCNDANFTRSILQI
ncbi:hypothetical protein Zmor_027271 [Zophobas morio]|uniref:Protein sleepless n=1 Tax=Zophobas morio TaxID=2755281 RepID=A0AA38HQJ2_9CUCU|nr:hypothetical protein Zmor_027271 [Zophobas morio]